MITLQEYIAKRLVELKNMKEEFEEKNNEDPTNWPMEMSEEEWFDQELAYMNVSQ